MIFLFFVFHILESTYSNIAPPPLYGSLCNASSTLHSPACNSQRHLGPSLAVSKIASNAVCPNNCGTLESSHSHQLNHHSSIPHSKSLDHYNEPANFLDHENTSRHSFDQPFSSNYKNYDCTDEMHTANMCVSSNRYPLRTTTHFPDHHYSQIGGYEFDTNMGICCHQNPHYECLNNFNSRSSKNGADYSNCNFQSK